MARKLTRANLEASGKMPHEFEHRRFYLLDPNSRPTVMVMPHDMTYSIQHLATNKVTGMLFMFVTALDADGLADFEANHPGATRQANGKLQGNRANWFINTFSSLDDGVSDPEDILKKGVEVMTRVSKDREERNRARTAQRG